MPQFAEKKATAQGRNDRASSQMGSVTFQPPYRFNAARSSSVFGSYTSTLFCKDRKRTVESV